MADFDFDLVTLGAGSGGVSASRRAASYGARVAICEDSRVGGTCVIRGCVPKKLLVMASQYRDAFADAAGYGWSLPSAPTIDWPRLQAAKGREIDRLEGIYVRLLGDTGVELVRGRARVVDAHTVEVAGRRLSSRHILVATGSHPSLPALHGIEHAITSNEALELDRVPRRLVIVGGGYIGVEFAGIFAALGAKVTMVIRGDSVLRGFDGDVRAALTGALRNKGVDIRGETLIEGIERNGDTLNLLTKMNETIECDTLLYATGRAPNTAGLGLTEAGVELDAVGAVVVDDASRTRVDNIFAVGDCTNRLNLTPVAIAEGRAVAETLFNRRPTTADHHGVPSAVFSQPPVGTVGLSERDARSQLGEVDVYVTNFKPMRHALGGRNERTMMKLVVERKSDRVVGVHMVGDDAPEIILGFAVALRAGATKALFDSTIGIHPTVAEEFVTLRDKRPDPSEP